MADAITNTTWDDPLMAAIRPAVREAIEAALDADKTRSITSACRQ